MIEKVVEIVKKLENVKDIEEPNIEKNAEKKEMTEISEKKRETNNEIVTRNSGLEGERHPETGVKFTRKEVETEIGIKEGVFPEFPEITHIDLPEDLYKESDRKQFDYCSSELKEQIKSNPELKSKFTPEQLEQIEEGETPDGYTWHHSEEKGRMELVDTEIHSKTGHTGGRNIWGGGTENR